jgi:DNA modification methylase
MTLCLHLSWFIEGASVHACRKTGRHFVAMEGDKEIFKAILEPLIVDTVTEGFKKQRLDGIDAAADVDLEELPDAVIKPLNRYCK